MCVRRLLAVLLEQHAQEATREMGRDNRRLTTTRNVRECRLDVCRALSSGRLSLRRLADQHETSITLPSTRARGCVRGHDECRLVSRD